MKQPIAMVATRYCSTGTQFVAKKLRLSKDTENRRVKCLSHDQHEQLPHHSKNFVYYSVALDTPKDFTYAEQFAVFNRGVMAG